MKREFDFLVIGNFVQDTIISNDGKNSIIMGGSVTYGSLAAHAYTNCMNSLSSNVDTSPSMTWVTSYRSPHENSENVIIEKHKDDTGDDCYEKVQLDHSREYRHTRIKIICSSLGNDLTPENDLFMKKHFTQNDSIQVLKCDCDGHGTTAYELRYDIGEGSRTLRLKNKGGSMKASQILSLLSLDAKEEIKQNLGSFPPLPDALLFVPVAGEYDEDVVIEVMQKINEVKQQHYHKDKQTIESQCSGGNSLGHPIVAVDIQGFIRDFVGSSNEGQFVVTRNCKQMDGKLKKLAPHIGFLKCEYSEALAIIGNLFKGSSGLGEKLSARECAILLQQNYGIPIVSVTLGAGGSYVAYDKALGKVSALHGDMQGNNEFDLFQTGNTISAYIPAFVPGIVVDETGSGDCFLACTVLELLIQGVHTNIISAISFGSAAASFKVEKKGPTGFATRDVILQRIQNGKRQTTKVSLQTSLTSYHK